MHAIGGREILRTPAVLRNLESFRVAGCMVETCIGYFLIGDDLYPLQNSPGMFRPFRWTLPHRVLRALHSYQQDSGTVGMRAGVPNASNAEQQNAGSWERIVVMTKEFFERHYGLPSHGGCRSSLWQQH